MRIYSVAFSVHKMFARVFNRILVKKSSQKLCSFNVKSSNSLVCSWRNFCTTQDNDLTSEDTLTEDKIQEISEGDVDIEKRLRLLLMELNVLKYDNKPVPTITAIDKEDWLELCSKTSYGSRLKYYSYLFKTEKSNENDKKRKKLKAEQAVKKKIELTALLEESRKSGKLLYNLTSNTLFLRIYESTISDFYNYKLIQAMLFGQKIIFDCSFDDSMSKQEATNCAKQLMIMFGLNRMHIDPYDLHLCNVDFNKTFMKELNKFIRPLREPWFPINLHTESYLDLFPKKNLVYLTPHCRTPLKEYDHDDIYIIGSLVDKSKGNPLTLAKAKVEGLRMAKLPLDDYLHWGVSASKNLTIEQVGRILLDVKHTNDWAYAMQHVPKRKIFENQKQNFDLNLQKKIKEIKENRKMLYTY